MAQNRAEPKDSNETGQVVSFRRRPDAAPNAIPVATDSAASHNEADDPLAQYEQENGDIDYRQRMLMNVIALVIVAALVGAGVWIADTITAMQRDQDCVLQGRANCAPIETPAPRHG